VEYSDSIPTFGTTISERRKQLHLTQSELLAANPTLAEIVSLRSLNELEQDRLDPRTLEDSDTVFATLAYALGLQEGTLRELASGFEQALERQKEFRSHIEFEAIAFRARTQRG